MWRMEDYFRHLGVEVEVFAVSPQDEQEVGVDEQVVFHGKVVGFQFKRPHPKGSHDVVWEVGQPDHQFRKIRSDPELFYALPTFLNRDAHRESLYHCLFWRPASRRRYGQVRRRWLRKNERSMSWDEMAERILRCDIGRGLSQELPLGQYLTSLRQALFADGDAPSRYGDDQAETEQRIEVVWFDL